MSDGLGVFPVAGAGGEGESWTDTWGACRDNCRRRHEGQDITAAEGTPLLAVTDGTIEQGNQPGVAGQWATLDAGDGRVFFYAHLSAYSTPNRAHVTAGQEIGKVGSTGNATGPHLHFGLKIGGVATNPADFLRGAHGQAAPAAGSSAGTVASDVIAVPGLPPLPVPFDLPSPTDVLGVVPDALGTAFQGIDLVGQALAAIAGAFTTVTQFLAAAARWLGDRRNWYRIYQFQVGVGMITVGGIILLRDVLADSAHLITEPAESVENIAAD